MESDNTGVLKHPGFKHGKRAFGRELLAKITMRWTPENLLTSLRLWFNLKNYCKASYNVISTVLVSYNPVNLTWTATVPRAPFTNNFKL